MIPTIISKVGRRCMKEAHGAIASDILWWDLRACTDNRCRHSVISRFIEFGSISRHATQSTIAPVAYTDIIHQW